ncbi:MAG TPA: excinuclease ABC subunit UvrC [Candidatus Saccharimonadales bacterium]|nr:excinuclease ABC subunit UvrC [Candidatus Saccharimonadales bacterium]
MNKRLEAKLAKLPKTPGVYFHKDSAGQIIYIGKAANLRNRVRQYFQKSRVLDPKTDALVSEIANVEWTEVETEADALFLEAELIRRYQPRFNILLRDDKSLQYVRIDYKSNYPTVTMVRRPLDDGAEYFGPYINGFAVKKALRYLRRAFPYAISKPSGQKRASLYYHLGLDPGLEEGRTSLDNYRANLRKLMAYLRGGRVKLTKEIEREMRRAAKAQNFEQAARLRNQLQCLQALSRQILFSDRELQDASKDMGLVELANLLGMAQPPRRIEGFDISHMQGTDNVASMVVFTNGLPDKTSYRKFKMRLLGNDDFAHMAETIRRRLRDENRRKWGIADLMLIDGGRGQLAAALQVRADCEQNIAMIGLAKKKEEMIIHKIDSLPKIDSEKLIKRAQKAGAYVNESADFIAIELPPDSHAVKLLQRIRDESHRFAVSYHSILKRGRQTASLLDEIPGVGPLTRKKLIRHFGSARAVLAASQDDLVGLLGPKSGARLSGYLAKLR